MAFRLASYPQIAAAAFGVTVLLAAVPVLLVALKLAAGALLVWKGRRLWRGPRHDEPAVADVVGRSKGRDFRDSLMVEVLNPRSPRFYFAFPPQFTAASATLPIWGQIPVRGVIANVTFSLADVVCIVCARIFATRVITSTDLATWRRRIGDLILRAPGAKVMVEAR